MTTADEESMTKGILRLNPLRWDPFKAVFDQICSVPQVLVIIARVPILLQ